MTDYLINFGNNPLAKKMVKKFGVTVPTPLARDTKAWNPESLTNLKVMVGGEGEAHPYIAQALALGKSKVSLSLDKELEEPYRQQCLEGNISDTGSADFMPSAIIFDATGIQSVAELEKLYAFFHPKVRQLNSNGRMIIVALDPPDDCSPEKMATIKAIEGFLRSLAKEIGKKASTAQLIRVADGQQGLKQLPSLLLFLLSTRSAFISGQVIPLANPTDLPGHLNNIDYLADKIVLITGAARGIGAATAQALAQEGAIIIGLDRPGDDSLLAKSMERCGGTPLFIDISEEGSEELIAKFIETKFGKIDIIVHNAGITRDKTLANMKPEYWQDTIKINLSQVIRITDRLESLIADNGRIVCLSSIAGIAGNFGQTNYSATKSGIIGYVSALSKKLQKRGITVNAVAPGHIKTRMTDSIPFVTREFARRLSNVSQGGLPIDIAQSINFLVSPGAAGLNGMTLRVCGGHLVGA